MKGIYLASYKAYHPGFDIVYQDINGKRDLAGDMLCIDLSCYDFIIATPPCNYWSRANYRRDKSVYSLETRYLLPSIIFKLALLNKPFIVENVRNNNLFIKYGLFNIPNVFVYFTARHTYFTNISLDLTSLPSDIGNIQNLSKNNRQGNGVSLVIEKFLTTIFERSFIFESKKEN